MALPPFALISPTVSLPVVSLMSETITIDPLRAKRCAVARPIPLPAPVTTATLIQGSLVIGAVWLTPPG
ncbi:Uncharacterised protein [Mycobacteroides abscessus subsp. abscessus]|nr:Uncharacterised protein [Mycobacteroides abscessus subsp. abscessus]